MILAMDKEKVVHELLSTTSMVTKCNVDMKQVGGLVLKTGLQSGVTCEDCKAHYGGSSNG